MKATPTVSGGRAPCAACAGYRFAIEEAVHVLAIDRDRKDDHGVQLGPLMAKSVDVSVALTWLRNALVGAYAGGPPDGRQDDADAARMADDLRRLGYQLETMRVLRESAETVCVQLTAERDAAVAALRQILDLQRDGGSLIGWTKRWCDALNQADKIVAREGGAA